MSLHLSNLHREVLNGSGQALSSCFAFVSDKISHNLDEKAIVDKGCFLIFLFFSSNSVLLFLPERD